MNLIKFARRKVSKKKIRYTEDGFDLDLTYITPQLIALGFPSEKAETMWRNPMTEVQRFFHEKHPGHERVYNLCVEPDRTYDVAKFEGRCARYAFKDHNAPRLKTIFDLCMDVDQWLSASPENVAAIHCKAGKGRTGVMMAAYLVFAGMEKTAEDALELFGKIRTKDSKGVTIPSQKRAVKYFETFLNDYYRPRVEFDWAGKLVAFTRLWLSSLPRFDDKKGCRPYIVIEDFEGHVMFDSRQSLGKPRYYKFEQPIEFDLGTKKACILRGEFLVRVLHQAVGGDREMLHCWLHTSFLPTDDIFILPKSQIDKARKDKRHKVFRADFELEFEFEDIDNLPAVHKATEAADTVPVELVAKVQPDVAKFIQKQQEAIVREREISVDISYRFGDAQHQLRGLRVENKHLLEANTRLRTEVSQLRTQITKVQDELRQARGQLAAATASGGAMSPGVGGAGRSLSVYLGPGGGSRPGSRPVSPLPPLMHGASSPRSDASAGRESFSYDPAQLSENEDEDEDEPSVSRRSTTNASRADLDEAASASAAGGGGTLGRWFAKQAPVQSRLDAALQFVASEELYLQELRKFDSHFRVRCEKAIEIGMPILTRAEITVVFANLPQLIELSESILAELQKLRYEDTTTYLPLFGSLGQVFIERDHQIKAAMGHYLDMSQLATAAESHLRQTNDAWRKFVAMQEACEATDVVRVMKLPELRVAELIELFDQLITQSPDGTLHQVEKFTYQYARDRLQTLLATSRTSALRVLKREGGGAFPDGVVPPRRTHRPLSSMGPGASAVAAGVANSRASKQAAASAAAAAPAGASAAPE